MESTKRNVVKQMADKVHEFQLILHERADKLKGELDEIEQV